MLPSSGIIWGARGWAVAPNNLETKFNSLSNFKTVADFKLQIRS